MKISEAIKTLNEIKTKFGDISITGGIMSDTYPLQSIMVLESNGMEVWPNNPNNLDLKRIVVDGVFLEG